MLYGVKVIHTHAVGDHERRFYEELILMVNAESYDAACEKAGRYMQDAVCDYTNVYGEQVKTIQMEVVDCFLAFDPEGDVQEVYSSFSMNRTALSEEAYYKAMTSCCGEEALRPLRNVDFN